MIKCEVEIDGDVIKLNGHELHNVNECYWDIFSSDETYLADWRLEEAIKYCMEN